MLITPRQTPLSLTHTTTVDLKKGRGRGREKIIIQYKKEKKINIDIKYVIHSRHISLLKIRIIKQTNSKLYEILINCRIKIVAQMQLKNGKNNRKKIKKLKN